MVVIVPAEHRALARQQLAEWPDIEMIVQPRNAGTGPGIMLPLRHVLARDPSARVLIAPSDHFVPNSDPIRNAIRRACAALATKPIVLVGVQPTHPETEYGWIVPDGGSAGSVQPVATFVEKPMAATAKMLMNQGALWNTFLMVAEGQALWDVASRRLPSQAHAICRCVDAGLSNESARIDAYRDLEDANFSSDVLANEPGLGVIRVDGSGWTDWGTPERVYQSLAGTPDFAALDARQRRADIVPRSSRPTSAGFGQHREFEAIALAATN
jgi:mannose-1-phosphate guanylyltransferase